MQFYSNWFDYGGRPEPDITDIATFRTKLQEQIHRRFLNCTEFSQPETTFVIDQQRFDAMTAFAADTTSFLDREGKAANAKQSAFLTLHGTHSIEALQSICKYGFLLPGQQHPKHGYALNMRVGNVYGDGVYSSSQPETASRYTTADANRQIVLIVSVLLPGKVSQVGRGGFFGGYSKGYDLSNLHNLSASPSTNRYEFAGNANTLTPDYSSMWIVASPLQIWPVAYVKLTVTDRFDNLVRGVGYATNYAFALTEWQRRNKAAQNVITMTHLVEDYWALPRSVYQEVTASQQLRRYFLVPASLLFDKAFNAAMAHHLKNVCAGSKTDLVYIFGQKVCEAVPVAQYEAAAARLMVRHKTHNVESALRRALDHITGSDASKLYHVLHVFADAGTGFDSDQAEAIRKDYAAPCRARYINVKYFFSRAFNAEKNESTRDALLSVKYHTQQEGIFETLYFDLSPFSSQQAVVADSQPAAAGAPTAWASVLESNEEELKNIGGSSKGSYIGDFSRFSTTLSVCSTYGEGFVTALDEMPVHEGRFNGMVVFKGSPPSQLSVDGANYRVDLARFVGSTDIAQYPTADDVAKKSNKKKQLDDQRPWENQWLAAQRRNRVLQELETPEPATVAPDGSTPWQYVAACVDALLGLLSKFRNSVIVSKDKLRWYGGAVELLANGVLAVCKDPAMDVVVARRLSAAAAQITTEINTLSSLKFSGEWFQAFQRMRFGRALARRIAAQEQQQSESASGVTEDNVLRAMMELDLYGVPVRVLQSAAAEVEPWTVVIDYVAVPYENEPDHPDNATLASATFRASLLETPVPDGNGRLVNAVVAWPFHAPTSPFMQAIAVPRDARKKQVAINRQRLLEHYYAQVFTRNPLLVLKQQGVALRTALWVRLTEILLIRSRPGPQGQTPLVNDAPLVDIAKFALELSQSVLPYFTARLRDRVRSSTAAPEEDAMVVQHSLNLDDVTRSTDGDDSWTEVSAPQSPDSFVVVQSDFVVSHQDIIAAPSLVQTLGYLLAGAQSRKNQAHATEQREAGALVKFDLLAESIVRMMHSYARSKKLTSEALQTWLFGLAETTADPSSAAEVIDVERCCRRTGRLFKFALSNCTPFAVVGALGFLQLFEDNATPELVADRFSSRAISMKTFLESNAPPGATALTWHPMATQLALFAFAAATHDRGSQRPAFSTALQLREGPAKAQSPMEYCVGLVTNLLQEMARKRAARAALGLRLAQRNASRRARLDDEIAECRRNHGDVTLFTVGEVNAMNRELDRRIGSGELPTSTPRYELSRTGLLKRHCCFPTCPMFLQCVATPADLSAMRNGDSTRNHGMRRHLARDLDAMQYIPGFHERATAVYRSRFTFEEYVAAMDASFANYGRYKNHAREHLRSKLATVFAFLSKGGAVPTAH